MKRLVIALIVVIVAACSTTQIYTPTDANVNKVEKATLAELTKGHDLYASKCGKCHKLYPVDSRDAKQWKEVLGVMGPKAKLDDNEVQLIHRYLINK